MSVYFGFALSASMLPPEGQLEFIWAKPAEVRAILDSAREQGILVPCLNPSHAATIAAARDRFGISVEIPEKAPKVTLVEGDSIVVMQISGLPRGQRTHYEYTDEEVEAATFAFLVGYVAWRGDNEAVEMVWRARQTLGRV